MWFKRLVALFGSKPPVKSDFEKMRDALKTSQVRTNPPKPLTQPPKIQRRSR